MISSVMLTMVTRVLMFTFTMIMRKFLGNLSRPVFITLEIIHLAMKERQVLVWSVCSPRPITCPGQAKQVHILQ